MDAWLVRLVPLHGGHKVRPEVCKPGKELGSATRSAALDCALRHAKHIGGISDRVAKHIDENQGCLLLRHEVPEGGLDI